MDTLQKLKEFFLSEADSFFDRMKNFTASDHDVLSEISRVDVLSLVPKAQANLLSVGAVLQHAKTFRNNEIEKKHLKNVVHDSAELMHASLAIFLTCTAQMIRAKTGGQDG